jgi:integrase
MSVWTPEQLRAFSSTPATTACTRLYALWMLVTTTGMRRGELAGFRWIDLDMEAAQVSPLKPRVVADYIVYESDPKTKKGKRPVALDPAKIAALREHRIRQEKDRAEVGAGWTESGLIFTQPDGRPIHPDLITKWFKRLARDAGLPAIGLHDVRHSYATAALKARVPAKVVSERLGHATIAITLDTYTHIIPGMDAAAVNTVADLILGTTTPAEEPEGPASTDRPDNDKGPDQSPSP